MQIGRRYRLIVLAAAMVFPAAAATACSDSTPPESTAAPSTGGIAPPLTDPALLDWRRFSPDPSVFGADATTMIFGSTTAPDGSRVVAVGVDRSATPDKPAVWTTENGARWSRVDAGAVPGATMQNSTAMRDVALGPGGYVAVGFEFAPDAEPPSTANSQTAPPGESTAAVWSSPDAGTWTRLTPPEPSVMAESLMTRVVAIPSGLLALGEDGVTGDAVAWLSPDGSAWQRIPATAGLSAADGKATFKDATAAGAALYIAGSVKIPDGRRAALWRSSDGGAAWERIEAPSFGNRPGAEIDALLAIPSGVVAAGAATEAGTDAAAVWVSPDGLAWNRVPHVEDVFGGAGGDAMLLLRRVGDGILGLGRASPGRLDPDAAVWTSPDGVNWKREAAPPDTFGGPGTEEFLTAAVAADRVIATGRSKRVDRDQLRFVDRELLLWSAQDRG